MCSLPNWRAKLYFEFVKCCKDVSTSQPQIDRLLFESSSFVIFGSSEKFQSENFNSDVQVVM
jgi:hypothetical protein